MTNEPDPPWPREAARAVGHELAAFAATLWAILSSPARFADDWASGRRNALNPLAFLLNALAVVGPWRVWWARVLDPNPPITPLWFELAKPLFPVVFNMTVTALFHLLARPLGARRPLRSSLAIALYVSGGPLALVNFAVAPLVLYGFIHRESATAAVASTVGNLVLLTLLLGYLVVMQASLHRLPRWRVTLAVLIAWAIFGFLSARVAIHQPQLVRSLLEG